MNLTNFPTSLFEVFILIIGVIPFTSLFEASVDWLNTYLWGINNFTTATILGAQEQSHEETQLPHEAGLRRKTVDKKVKIVDAAGNDMGMTTISVVSTPKMGLAAMQFYIMHALFSTIIPPYFFFVIGAKIFLSFLVIPYVRQKWNVIASKIYYYQLSDMIIDNLNKLPLVARIRKTFNSRTAYPLIILGPFVLVIFWSFKKFYLGRKKNEPQGPKENSRGQAALNLGLMVLAFVGYSDFGLWKKFQDWIRFSDYANKLFGDAATDTSCINYNPKNFNLRCVGRSKGAHACIACAADMITKEPQVQSVLTRKYDISSIMDEPAPYYYELVHHLFLKDKELPVWYTSLRTELQQQIFKSHYHEVYEKTGILVPHRDRLDPEKILSKQFSFHRDERLCKWTIVALTEQEVQDISESDSDEYNHPCTIQAQHARSEWRKTLDRESKKNEPHGNNEEKDHTVPMFDSASINVTVNCIKCSNLVSYPIDSFAYCSTCGTKNPLGFDIKRPPRYHAEAFEFTEKDNTFDLSEHFPFLALLPKKVIKPLIFLTAMCLILYGSYYYYRKRNKDEINKELQAEVIRQAAAKIVEENATTSPVLEDLQLNEDLSVNVPEGPKGLSRHRGITRSRHQKREHVHRTQDTSDVTVIPKTQYQLLKQAKKRNYIVYDIDKLELILEQQGLVFLDEKDNVYNAKTKREFDLYVAKGYQYIPDNKIIAAYMDVSKIQNDDHVSMEPFSKAASHKPLKPYEYKFIVELLEDDAVLPDKIMLSHLYSPTGKSLYHYDPDSELYIWLPYDLYQSESNEVKDKVSTSKSAELVSKILESNEVKDKVSTPKSAELIPKILSRPSTQVAPTASPLKGPIPLTVREENYEKYKKIIDDLDFVQANKILAEQRSQQLQSLIIAEPESNLSHISSNACPYKDRCTTSGCVRTHPTKNMPEGMFGSVKIDHYPDDLRTDFVYPIFQRGCVSKVGTCFLTPFGFISLYHVPKDRPLIEFYLKIHGVEHTIASLQRFPTQYGYDKRELPQDFQDNIVFKLHEHYQVVKDLPTARAGLPAVGMKVMVVTSGSNLSVRTETAELELDPETGMYLIKTNNDHGDSGSPVMNVMNNAVIGTYWGRKIGVGNFVLPFDLTHVMSINGNQKFQLTKNFHPSL